MASCGAIATFAQGAAPKMNTSDNARYRYAPDGLLSRWVIDVNLLGGVLTQDLTTASTIGNYPNAIGSVSNTGKLKFENGTSFGFDAQLGFFFGRGRNLGIGAGFMYLHQEGDMKLDQFHVEYQSTDIHGSTFRQLITANGESKERLSVTNINIPLVLKYKNRFSKHWGFTADAGALFNVQERNEYSTNASFDYEAIYRLTGSPDNPTAVYDNSPTPIAAGDVFYTRAEHDQKNMGEDLNTYFSRLRNVGGYNVGLGVKPATTSGTVSYNTVSVGLLVQPGINYYFSDAVALSVGPYFIYQPFKNSSNNGYRMSDQLGQYSSVLNTVTASNNMSFGANLGVRIYIGKGKDTDHDGIPDKDDRCPTVYGSRIFHGCPDTDGDGIADPDDSCPRVPGILKFHGCPDSDGDGIPDKEDACPYQAGPVALHGCPDRDGDGIPDKDDLCPDKAGPEKYHGCPDTDGDGIPDNEDQCPEQAGPIENHGCPPPPPPPPVEEIKVTTPILFEVNKTVIRESSYPVLEVAVKKLNEDKESYVIVDGYTDITGKPAYNKALSMRRAKAVKEKLIKMGVKAKRIKVVGHGSSNPAESNDTEEGRMKNRRAVMHLNVGE